MRAPWMTAWPTPPQPMTATVAPGLDLRGVERGADAGGDAAADERELLVGEVGLDLHERSTRRRSSRRRRCRGRSSPMYGAAVGARAASAPSCAIALVLAQVRLVVQAEPAVAARGDERRRSRGRPPSTRDDVAADLEHGARALVAEDHRRRACGDAAVREATGRSGTRRWRRCARGRRGARWPGALTSSITSGSLYAVRMAARIGFPLDVS